MITGLDRQQWIAIVFTVLMIGSMVIYGVTAI